MCHRRVPTLLVAVAFAWLGAAKCGAAEKPADRAGIEFFEQLILPELVGQCYECHSAKSKILQANLHLDTREGTLRGGDSGAAVVPGESGASLLVDALRYEGFEMPPKGRLPDAVV